jgi:hypothetical protein
MKMMFSLSLLNGIQSIFMNSNSLSFSSLIFYINVNPENSLSSLFSSSGQLLKIELCNFEFSTISSYSFNIISISSEIFIMEDSFFSPSSDEGITFSNNYYFLSSSNFPSISFISSSFSHTHPLSSSLFSFSNSRSSLSLDNSHFIHISSLIFSPSSSSSSSPVIINETEFKNIQPSSSIEGGGMRTFPSRSSPLDISSSSFKECKGKGENSKGGGIYIEITEIEEN